MGTDPGILSLGNKLREQRFTESMWAYTEIFIKTKHGYNLNDQRDWLKYVLYSNNKTWTTIIAAVVQLLSHVRLFVSPQTAVRQASLSITNSQSLLKLMSIESVMPSNHLILCHLLLLLPSIFPSIRVFSNESFLLNRWPKYWSFSFRLSPSNESSQLISFRIDWFDFLLVQGTVRSLLQHHSLKAPSQDILWKNI